MLALKDLIDHYTALCSQVPLRPIRNEPDYGHAVAVMNALLDAGVADEDHPLADLVATLGELISDYEEKWRVPHASPAEVLRFLMSQHALGQSDLPEVGSQGVVSEILSGKRALNVRQIKELAQRFAVSPSVFVQG